MEEDKDCVYTLLSSLNWPKITGDESQGLTEPMNVKEVEEAITSLKSDLLNQGNVQKIF